MLSGGKGLSVATVNYYMTTMAGMFQFAADNGYIRKTRLTESGRLKGQDRT